jgi:hypothetical protein
MLCEFSKGQALMVSVSRDVVALIRIFTSCLTAAFLIFFISSLSGEDLIKNNSFIEDLDRNLLHFIAIRRGSD